MKRAQIIAVAVVVVAIGVACGRVFGSGPPRSVTDAIGDRVWLLVEGTVDGDRLQLVDGSPVDLRLDGGRLVGQAACNTYSTDVRGSGSGFTIGQVSSTLMACADPAAMDLESAFLAALSRTTDAARDGDRLVLTGDGIELAFS